MGIFLINTLVMDTVTMVEVLLAGTPPVEGEEGADPDAAASASADPDAEAAEEGAGGAARRMLSGLYERITGKSNKKFKKSAVKKKAPLSKKIK